MAAALVARLPQVAAAAFNDGRCCQDIAAVPGGCSSMAMSCSAIP